MTKAEQKKAVQFTRMCKFWRTNECKMGADCTFAHATSELRPSPKPCFEFSKTGFCKRGQACRFVHATESKKSKDLPSQLCNPDVIGPSFRPVGPADVVRCSSAAASSQLEMFDMPRLRQLFPPVEGDFHRLPRSCQLQDFVTPSYAHDFAQGDFRQTAGAATGSGPSEVFAGFEGMRVPSSLRHEFERDTTAMPGLSPVRLRAALEHFIEPDGSLESFWL